MKDRAAIAGIGQTEFSASRRVGASCSSRASPSPPRSPKPGIPAGAMSTVSSVTPSTRSKRPSSCVRWASRRSRGRAACPTAAVARWACCCTRRARSVSGAAEHRRRVSSHPRPLRRDAGSARRRPHRARRRRTPAPPRCNGACRYGVLTPASWMSLNATRYMHDFGVTSADFGRAVVQLRAYAATNPAAWGYQRPDHARGSPGITLDRRAVHPPLRLLPGDRRVGRGRDHERRARRRPRGGAGDDRRRVRRRPVRAGDRVRPLPPADLS